MPSSATVVTPLLGRYQPPGGVFDELLETDGSLRAHWRLFARELHSLGDGEFTRRWDQARRMLYENGVAYSHDAGQGAERPWELDPLPALISPADWARLSEGLVQRARLANAILADVYGPQHLLHDQILPPEIVLSHPGFLRRFHGAAIPRGLYLHASSADVGRTLDGNWHVLADGTQSSPGVGYALENRLVVSQMLPQIFRDAQVQRLAPYFVALRDTLHNLAAQHRDNPRIVLLTAGPRGESYFEDAYLARYLGFTLVEGEDLTVRDSGVCMKTLAGLIPVDVIFRRLNDDDCDPLELRGDSPFGVPGLAQAVRTGQVAIANALGTGLLESPAFLPFLPAACRFLLQEDLKVPSATTWWCGQPQDLQYVLERLDQLILRPTTSSPGIDAIVGAHLTRDQLAALADRIRARPGRYVAQVPFPHASVPVWSDAEPVSRHLTIRTFLAAAGDSWTVMHGGLAQHSPTPEPLMNPDRRPDGTKDLWVLSAGPVASVSLLRQGGQATSIRRSGNELPSRVADNLFWLGRHVERAEGGARLLRAILNRLTSELDSASLREMPALIRCLADQGQIEPGFAVEGIREHLPAIEQALPAAIFDEGQPGSLRSTLNALDRTGSIVRDRLSIDIWRILRQINQDFVQEEGRVRVEFGDALAMLNELLIDLAAFSGLCHESMTRTQGWRFLDMGRRIERTLHTLSLIRSALVPVSPESSILEAILEVADSSMTYRSRYLANLQVAPVIDLLITDDTNPRSIAFQLDALAAHVEQLPREATPFKSPEQKIVMSALTTLRLAEVDTLAATDGGIRPHLERLLARLSTQLPELSNVLSRTYLTHAGLTRQLTHTGRG